MQKGSIYFSCDPVYYRNHGKYLLDSCIRHNESVFVNVDTEDFFVDYNYTRNAVFTDIHLQQYFPEVEKRLLYALGRFIIRPPIMGGAVLILDADSFLRKPIDWDDFDGVDYSFFHRDPLPNTTGLEREGSRIAAGAVYIGEKFVDVFYNAMQNFTNPIISNASDPLNGWFLDQFALKEIDNMFKHKYKSMQMPEKYIDWHFREDTTIWTGKGPRKTSPQYLEERERA